MTTRIINHAAAGVLDTDLLTMQRSFRNTDSAIVRAMLGEVTVGQNHLNGLEYALPGGMVITIENGCLITAIQEEDPNPYGSLPLSGYGIRAIAVMLTTANFTCPAPTTVGQSINYLIYATYSLVDATPVVLYYENSENPAQVFRGVNNSGTPDNTTRTDTLTVGMVAGTSAATGAQTTPGIPAGSVPMYVVTVPYGETSLISGNVAVHPSAPFIAGLLAQHHLGTPGQAPQIDLTREVQLKLPMANLNASDTLGSISATQVYAGNPNGHVAGNAGIVGTLPPSTCWDITNDKLYYCITSGIASAAVWLLVNPTPIPQAGLSSYIYTNNATITLPVGYYDFELGGGGGGGGGCDAEWQGAGGGASGGTLVGTFTVSATGVNLAFVAGAAGLGGYAAGNGTNYDGTAGGSSSLGGAFLVAYGGRPGYGGSRGGAGDNAQGGVVGSPGGAIGTVPTGIALNSLLQKYGNDGGDGTGTQGVSGTNLCLGGNGGASVTFGGSGRAGNTIGNSAHQPNAGGGGCYIAGVSDSVGTGYPGGGGGGGFLYLRSLQVPSPTSS